MQKQNEIAAIADMIKNTVDCEKIYLFGSYAYGEPTEDSDLDFYVVIPDDSVRPLEARRRIYRMLGDVKRTMPVDILASRASRFEERRLLPTMERQIAGEGVVLYERTGFGQPMVQKG